MPQIDKSLAPKSKRRVVEFNVQNGMKTLHITANNEDNGWLKMIKPFAKKEVGKWCVKKKVVHNKPKGQPEGLTHTQKRSLQRTKAIKKKEKFLERKRRIVLSE